VPTAFDDLPAVKTAFDDLPDAPKGAFDDLPEVSRNSRIDAGLSFFRQTHPQLYPEQGPGLEQVDSLQPATPQPAGPPPLLPELRQTPERPNTLETAMSGIGQPLEEPPGITPRMENPENLSPLEVLRKGTTMPFPRVTAEQVGSVPFGPYATLPKWVAGPVAGTEQAVADLADFMTSPAGVATVLTGGVAGAGGAAEHAVASQIPKATAYLFAGTMAKEMPQQFDQVMGALNRGDSAEATRQLLGAMLSLSVVGHGAKTAVSGTGHALASPETLPGSTDIPSGEQSLPQPAVQPTAKPVDVTGDLINELQGGLNKNQIVKSEKPYEQGQVPVPVPVPEPAEPKVATPTPFDNLPEAKPETPVETPGDIVRKAVEEQPLKEGQRARQVRAEQSPNAAPGEWNGSDVGRVPIMALKMRDGRVMIDPGAGTHADAVEFLQLDPNEITERGIVEGGHYRGLASTPEKWAELNQTEKPPQDVTGVETPGTRETLPSAGESTEARPEQPSGEKAYLSPEEQAAEQRTLAEELGQEETAPQPEPQPAKPAPSPVSAKFADRFRKMADALDKQIEDKRRDMTQNPTPKRNREYRSRLHDADNLERTQKGLRALADAYESDSVPPELANVRTKDAVHTLVRKSTLGGGYYDVIPDPEYADKSPAGRALQRLIERETAEQSARRAEREKAQEINRLEESVRFSDIPGFFPTPKPLAEEMVRRAEIKPGESVLEPSAGKGDLADAVKAEEPSADITTVERMSTLRKILEAKGYKVSGDDFMQHEGKYDRVVMNPPFEKGQDAEHIQRAYEQLKPGGKLVALASEGTFSRADRRSTEFRNWLDSVGGTSDKVEPGVFAGKDAFRQTGVASRIVEITKPEKPIEQRGPLGGNLSTFGLFDPEAYRPAFEELSDRGQMLFRWGDKQREKVLARYRRGDTRNFIARTKDGSDSIAKLMGQRGANIILHELNRSFDVKPEDVLGERSQLREMALTMRIESGGERNALQEMRYRLTSAQAEGVNLVWKRKALKAIDFAEQNWDKLEPAATEYQRLTDAENAFENANGIKTLYRKGGYVFHAQDVDESFGMPSTGQAQEAAGAPAPFRHIRDYQTYAEAIANGVSPVSLNAIDLLQKRLELGQRLIRYGDWADEFQKLTDPHTKQPIAVPPEVRTRADGTEDMTAPAGYQLVHFAGRDFALHNGYAGLFGNLTKPSWMQGTEFRQNVMKTFSGMKHATLLLDTYHMARLAFWNSMTRLGLPTYARGVTILDNTTPELQKMIANGEIPREWGEQLVQRKQVLERMIRQGLNVGSVGDNLYTDFLQNIPGIGTFNKWLFSKYQRGAMAEVALIEHDRQKQMFPDLNDDQLAARVAKDVNTRFGNLQSQSWIKSRTGQDLARIIFLAPQWNESLIRAELGALRQLAAAPGQSFRAGRPAMGALARSVGLAALGIFVGNQLINMATRGTPTWENPEEGFGAKISAYIPDLLGGPGFFLNPMSVPMEITNLLWRASERHGGDLTLALRDFAAGRFSGLAKGVWTAMTGYTPMGQPVKGGWDRVGQSIAQAAPLPISGGPVLRGIAQAVTGENREKYPGEIQKQAMQSFGVKTEPVPDAQRRMYDLAAKFKQSKGITEPPTREMSFYGDLTSAVKTGNMKAAGEALDKILTLAKGSGEPHTLDDVDKYYRQYPQRTFTNNRSMEEAFKRTLSPEQLRVYGQAVKDRENIAATVQRLTAQRRR
jgi:protein-L-isoaspartate O-methyltransferase